MVNREVAAMFPSPPALHPRLTGAPSTGEWSVHLASCLQSATARLQQALNLDRREARLEAQILTAHALGVERAWLIAHDRDILTTAQCAAIESLTARREQGEPVAYILGEKEFYGRMFKVTPDVLIPRSETELLVEAALERLPQDRPARILDLGTGSGCIAITLALERPDSRVWAVEQNAAALAVSRENAVRHGVENLCLLLGDWFSPLEESEWDLIVSNPPYIASADPHLNRGDLRFEPEQALSSGADGLSAIRCIVAGSDVHLRDGGALMIEHGLEQGAACRELFHQAGFRQVASLRDLAGHERVTLGARR
jgi:release factor glutamine methyltransferase